MRVARLTSGAYLSAPGVLGAVARALDIPTEEGLEHEAVRERVHAHIAGLLERGITCVVMVDDADDLEPAALEELVRIAELRPETERIRVLLFATPALRAALAQAAGARRAEALTHELVLEPFSLNELRAYLRWRLERAGLKGAPPFDEADYQRIHRRSGGVPGRADVLAAQLLFRRPWWQRPAPVALLCGLAGMVLGVALLNLGAERSFTEAVLYGFGAAVGFSLVLVLFAALRERIAAADVPGPFRGPAIGLVTAGLMSLAFMGFTGLVR